MSGASGVLVVVFTRSYVSGLNVIRSLGQAGYTVDLILSVRSAGAADYVKACRYLRHTTEVVCPRVRIGENTEENERELMSVLMSYENDSASDRILFPTDDFTALFTNEHRQDLERVFHLPHISPGGQGSLIDAMDKHFQHELARQQGIAAVHTWPVSLAPDPIVIPQDLVFPCFCKPLHSIAGYKYEMKKCCDDSELSSHLGKLRESYANRSVLVEEFAEIEAEYNISGVCFDDEVFIPACLRKVVIGSHLRGSTAIGQMMPLSTLGETARRIVSMMKSLQYRGVFDMELFVMGGEFYFSEVNLRCGGPMYASLMCCDVNLPVLYLERELYGTPFPEIGQINVREQLVVCENIVWSDYCNGKISTAQRDEYLALSSNTVLCQQDDPEPGKAYLAEIKRTSRKTRLKLGVKALLRR